MTAARRLAVICKHTEQSSDRQIPVLPEATAATPAINRALLSSYDYIVVGAGSAGCVVASRLSEDPSVSVLLIEAGGNNQQFRVRSPFVTCMDLQNSDLDWAYRTTRQASMDDRTSYWPRGKCLGGCSSINYMLYVRGDPRNYDHWARQGCDGWSFEEVLPYFKKSENLITDKALDEDVHGTGGPLNVTVMGEHDFRNKAIMDKFLQSCESVGIPKADYNGRRQRGASLAQVTIRKGVRQDTASTFLYETGALTRPNLTVLTDAVVTQVVMRGLEATGVSVQRTKGKDPPMLLSAAKEVVVCCGAVGTPHLLMLSGIGPKAHLAEHGIDCIRDLPVGENLQDHLFCPVGFGYKSGLRADFAPSRPLTGGLLPVLANHLLFGSDIFSFSTVQGIVFDHSGLKDFEEENGNDLELHVVGFSFTPSAEQRKRHFGLEQREDRPLTRIEDFPGLRPAEGFTLLPTILLPKSRGFVKLASADPFKHPVIEPNYLKDERDVASAVAGVRLARRVVRSPPLSEVLEEEVHDPSIPHEPESDDYIKEYVRRTLTTVYHPVGTAKMGAEGDKTAVVDPRLRVQGVRGLRVADASIMPTLVSGNTNAPSIMIGERAADFLRQGS